MNFGVIRYSMTVHSLIGCFPCQNPSTVAEPKSLETETDGASGPASPRVGQCYVNETSVSQSKDPSHRCKSIIFSTGSNCYLAEMIARNHASYKTHCQILLAWHNWLPREPCTQISDIYNNVKVHWYKKLARWSQCSDLLYVWIIWVFCNITQLYFTW